MALASKNYFAFISYSRSDDGVAKWLQRSLEGFRTPRQLAGSAGAHGPVRDKTAPVFRDREDLSGGGQLADRLRDALKRTDFLIVLCSPKSASSRWVNEEVEFFAAQHGMDRVFPVIVAGEPNSDREDLECFPPALRSAGVLAADLRELKKPDGRIVGDGRIEGRLKLIAGMLGVELDQLRKREAARRRRQLMFSSVATGVFAVVAVAATALGFIAKQQSDIAEKRLVEAERRLEIATEAGLEALIIRATVVAVEEQRSFYATRAAAKAESANYTTLAEEYAERTGTHSVDELEFKKARILYNLALHPDWMERYGMQAEWLGSAHATLLQLLSKDPSNQSYEQLRHAVKNHPMFAEAVAEDAYRQLRGARSPIIEVPTSESADTAIEPAAQPPAALVQPPQTTQTGMVFLRSERLFIGERFKLQVVGPEGTYPVGIDFSTDGKTALLFPGSDNDQLRPLSASGEYSINVVASEPRGEGKVLVVFARNRGEALTVARRAIGLTHSQLLSVLKAEFGSGSQGLPQIAEAPYILERRDGS